MHQHTEKPVHADPSGLPPPPTSVIQLRIHGVGGATPDGLLGLPAGSEVVRVAGDESAAVFARPQEPHIEGYVWSKLTRSAWAQALWIILLPFTLFNVANWMYPRRLEGEGSRVLSRGLMLVLGISLTVSYLLWEMTLIQQLFYQWQLGGWVGAAADSAPIRLVLPAPLESAEGLGYILSLLALLIVNGTLYFVARRTRQDFEDVTSPVIHRGKATEPAPAIAGFPIQDRDALRSGHFWSRRRQGDRLLWLHVFVELLFLAGFAIWAFPRAEEGEPGLGLGPLFRWTTQVQVVLIVALLAAYLARFAGRRNQGAWGFRFVGPPIMATLSVGLTIGAFSGLSSFVGARTGLPPAVLLDLSPAFGAGSLAFLVSLAVWGLIHWLWRKEEQTRLCDEGISFNNAVPGEQPNGIRRRLFKRVAVYRSFAKSIPRLDLVFTATALTFIASAGMLVFWEEIRFPRQLGTFGAWLVAASVTVLLPVLIYRSFKVSARAKVGIIWDVLTFWPRRYHPFAVRPYAERAVPEFEWRILRHLEAGCRVVVCAHSQGSVLAYAALMELSRHFPKRTRNVALVTFGSPLRTLYARFFPGYFSQADFRWLRDHMYRVDARPCIPWKNFFRRTDYVGQELFEEPEFHRCDTLIHDPPRDPPYGDVDPNVPIWIPPDPPQPNWTRPLVHSYYNNARELRDWVDGELPAAIRRTTTVKGGT
jgi:hypothetical protein